MQTGKGENANGKGSSSDFAKAVLLLASIPATLIAAVVFDEYGGHILGGYFALIFALVAFGALRKFVVSVFVESMIVEGVVVSLSGIWCNMNKTSGLLLTLLIIAGCSDNMSLSTTDIVVPNEGTPPPFIYTVNLNSQKMFCGGIVNDMEQLDNLSTDEGDVMTGFNATAFLAPGINAFQAIVGSADMYNGTGIHRGEGNCQLVLNAVTQDNYKTELTSLNISVEEGKPTAKMSKTYPAKHQTELTDLNGITEGYATTFNRNVFIKTIPEWRWVNATPFVENGENMKKLYRAYSELQEMIKNRDIEGLKAAWSLSSREKAMADGYGSTPDEIFNYVGIESRYERYKDIIFEPIGEWSDFKLVTYAEGRLVRLENTRGHSPLRVSSIELDEITTFTPYFSLIDGRVVISR